MTVSLSSTAYSQYLSVRYASYNAEGEVKPECLIPYTAYLVWVGSHYCTKPDPNNEAYDAKDYTDKVKDYTEQSAEYAPEGRAVFQQVDQAFLNKNALLLIENRDALACANRRVERALKPKI